MVESIYENELLKSLKVILKKKYYNRKQKPRRYQPMKRNPISRFKASFLFMLAFVMTLSLAPAKTDAAKKTWINPTSMTLQVGSKAKLTLRNNKRKIKWWSTNKSVATVTQKGIVKAKGYGRCRIAAKVASKKYVCKVIVKRKASSTHARHSTKYVYITKTGEKYHTSTCRYLWNSKIKISLSSARAQGYTACSVCRP